MGSLLSGSATCATRQSSRRVINSLEKEASHLVDRQSRTRPALHVHHPGTPYTPAQSGDYPSYAGRYLSQYQYPRDRHFMDLLRLEPGGVRGPSYPAVRKGSHHVGRQHSAYRVHHLQRPECRQGLLAARSKSRDGERTSHGGFAIHSQATSAGGAASSNHQLQRLECANPAAWGLGEGSERAAIERLQFELHSPAAHHGAGCCCSFSVWRQTASDHGQYGPEAHAVERPLAERCFGGADGAKHGVALRHRKDRTE